LRRTLHFEPSARLQSILSRELVADPNVAILEFVKNSYDADATEVRVEFDFGDSPQGGVITIADNGTGMNLEEFGKNWMRPGYSEKVDERQSQRGRVPVGEKGLGRLAAGRLGDVLDVFTRKRKRDPWLHAQFVWSDFDDMNENLTAVGIPVDDESEPDRTAGEVGTVIRISALRLNWDARVPGRKAPGRHPTRIGRLRQDMEMMLLPLSAADDEFDIWLAHNSSQPEDEPSGRIEPPFLDLIDYRHDFEFMRGTQGWRVKRITTRSPDLLAQDFAKEQKLKRTTRKTTPVPSAEAPAIEEVGAFSGSLFYAPDSADRLRTLRAPVGVMLYRDGVRVDPYGAPGNDWLGVQAKKASRQGWAPIQPAALYGAVRITKNENSKLRSQANREGLIENEAHDAFLQLCRTEFAFFEQRIHEEYLTKRWRSPAQNRQREAQATQNYALTLTRTLMHAVNQPVGTANASLFRLQTFINRRPLPDSLRHELQDLHDATARQLGRIGEAIQRVLDVVDFDPAPEELDLGGILRDVARAQRRDDIIIDVEAEPGLTVQLPRAPVHEAVMELV
jgi:hypothetical protein